MVLRTRWANRIVILIANICAVLRLLTALPCGVRRLVARTVVDRIDPLTLQCAYFEIYPAEFDNIANSHHLLLIIREEVLQNLVD